MSRSTYPKKCSATSWQTCKREGQLSWEWIRAERYKSSKREHLLRNWIAIPRHCVRSHREGHRSGKSLLSLLLYRSTFSKNLLGSSTRSKWLRKRFFGTWNAVCINTPGDRYALKFRIVRAA